jgi:hypothetical protein
LKKNVSIEYWRIIVHCNEETNTMIYGFRKKRYLGLRTFINYVRKSNKNRRLLLTTHISVLPKKMFPATYMCYNIFYLFDKRFTLIAGSSHERLFTLVTTKSNQNKSCIRFKAVGCWVLVIVAIHLYKWYKLLYTKRSELSNQNSPKFK